MDVLQHEGVGYRWTDFLADRRDTDPDYDLTTYKAPWKEKKQVYHEFGPHKVRYEVYSRFYNPAGEQVDEAGNPFDEDITHVWTDKFETFADIVAKAEEEIESRESLTTDPVRERFASRPAPDVLKVGRIHVYAKDVATKQPW